MSAPDLAGVGPRGAAPDFLAGDGEVARLLRARDWAAASLGSPWDWPQPLRVVVRLMLNTRHPVFVFWGPDLLCFYNDAYSASIGPERHPLALVSPGRKVWAEIWDVIGPQIALVMAGKGATWHENHLVPITRHGRREDVYWTYSYSPIEDASAPTGVGGVLVLCSETTEQVRVLRQHAEHAAAQAAERDRVWRNSRDLLVVIGMDGTFRTVNPAWETVLGYAPEEVEGRSFLDFICPEDAARTQVGLDRAVSRQDLTHFENRYRHRDGTPRWISWHTSFAGNLLYAYGRDITAQKQTQADLALAQEALRQSQKMEAVGQLTGGIAHDFNNMLQAIVAGIGLARRRLGAGDAAAAVPMLDLAADAAGRAGALTRRLLAFGRRQALNARAVDLPALIEGMSELVRRTAGAEISVVIEPHPGCWPVLCDANQLESALLNLAINGRDAMLPAGGVLRFATRNVMLDAAETQAWDGVAPGDYVQITVSDTGVGMPPDVLAHACEPFFTTKPEGQGTGLGLSQLYGFVRQSNGIVRLESAVGVGTSAHIFLPRSADAAPGESRRAQAGPGASQANRPATVLLVEDEAAIRALAAEALRGAGCRVIEAYDGTSGLNALRDAVADPSGGGLDLLITDIGLPGGLNGRQLAEAARDVVAHLPVLMITGHGGGALDGRTQLGAGIEILPKPFELDALTVRARTMLGAVGRDRDRVSAEPVQPR